jgi:hypothetical protein
MPPPAAADMWADGRKAVSRLLDNVARVIGGADAVEVMPAPLAGHGATESGTSTHLR